MVLELPNTYINGVTRVLTPSAADTVSPFTLTAQSQDWGGRRWDYTLSFSVMTDDDSGAGDPRAGRKMAAFFARLGGPATPFLFRDPMAVPLEPFGRSVTVLGAGQAGSALITTGWGSTFLREGDFFSLGSGSDTRFYTIVADAVPVAGVATLNFVPPLRKSPAHGAAVEIDQPAVLLRLTGAVPAGLDVTRNYQFSCSCIEAI